MIQDEEYRKEEERDSSDQGEDAVVANTGWAKPPSLKDLKQDLTDAKNSHDTHINDVDRWLDNLNITGAAQVKTPDGKSSVVPKLIRKQAEWRFSALSEPFLSTEDIFNISPVTHDDKAAAEQNELVLNNQFNTKLNKVKFFDEYVRTCVSEGTVIVKVAWDSQDFSQDVEVKQFDYIPDGDPIYAAQLEQLAILKQKNPEQFFTNVPTEMQEALASTMETGIVVKPVFTGMAEETQTISIVNQPSLEVCNYKNVTIDPTAQGDMDKANFIIHSFETSLAQLEKDGKYKNLDQIKVDDSSVLSEPDHDSEDNSYFNFSDKPRKKIVAYEYWGFGDVEGTGTLVPFVATWVGNTLIRMETNPYPDQKLPFVVVPYMPVKRSVYGEPDGELLEDNQKIAGAVTRGMIDVLGRSANGQMGARKDALDIINKRKFDAGEDYEYNATIDPRTAFHMHTFPEIPSSAQYILDQQNSEAESITGIKSFSQGITGQALGSTATGIRSALDATSKRELGILRRLADGIKEIGRKIISMNSEFLDEEEIVRITNDQFVPVKRDDLAGNFDLKLAISTAEADNQKAEELAYMLQTMGNNMDTGMSKLILSDITKLRKMPALARRIEEYEPQPDPMAQKKAELELALIQAQIDTEVSQAEENRANAQLYLARIGEASAKARETNSSSDLKDLEYVETESGVTQERALEKMNTQTKGNIALKAVEGKIKEKEETKPNNQLA